MENDWEYRFQRLEDRTVVLVPAVPYFEGAPASPGDPVDAFLSNTFEADWDRIRQSIMTDQELRAMIGYAGAAARVRQLRYRERLVDAANLLAELRASIGAT